MHELSIAMSILDACCERAEGRSIVRIAVRVGALSAVMPDALRFSFDVAKAGTLAEAASLDIEEVPGRARCLACGEALTLDRPFGRCACGGTDLQWLSGDELTIREMELT